MTYIIAECGLNHNGSIETAKELIQKANEVGADCAKFQMYRTETLCSKRHQPKLFKQFKDCELPWKDFVDLKHYCDEIGIDFMCTPEGIPEAVYLNNLVDTWKISSVGACNPHLLKLINTFRKPVYISDGLLNDYALAKSIVLLSDCIVTPLSCVCDYPAEENYRVVNSIRILYSHYKRVGYSDHTLGSGNAEAISKDGLASVFEKHFTLDKTQDGFDHHMSLEPKEMKEYIRRIRNA